MKRQFSLSLMLVLLGVSFAAERPADDSKVRLAPSNFRLIAEVRFNGRDLFELAIAAGMYKRQGNEYLPGAERGAVSVKGRTWHGSNGVGLVAYDPQMQRYSIYYLQKQAVPGHHLDIVYADEDFIFFTYGFHKDMPVKPALEVYSTQRRCFARIDSVSTEGGTFGHFDDDVLAQKKPGTGPPQQPWDDRRYAKLDRVPLYDPEFGRPDRVTLQDGVFRLYYHASWGIDEFVTAIQFSKTDLDQELDKMTAKKADARDGK